MRKLSYYALRTNDQNTIATILSASIGVTLPFANLSWYLDQIRLSDICFIKISGDEAFKLTNYDNSLVAIARVISLPYGHNVPTGMSITHATIDIKILYLFNSVTADELYKYPSLKNTLSIGASTKGMPNQAIGRLSMTQGEDIIKALINEGRLNTYVLSIFNINNRSLDILLSSTIII